MGNTGDILCIRDRAALHLCPWSKDIPLPCQVRRLQYHELQSDSGYILCSLPHLISSFDHDKFPLRAMMYSISTFMPPGVLSGKSGARGGLWLASWHFIHSSSLATSLLQTFVQLRFEPWLGYHDMLRDVPDMNVSLHLYDGRPVKRGMDSAQGRIRQSAASIRVRKLLRIPDSPTNTTSIWAIDPLCSATKP